jgi:tetratricopeptide (TPR) repeat protein
MTPTTAIDRTGILARKGYWPAIAEEYLAAGKYARTVEYCLEMLEHEAPAISGRVILGRAYFHAGQYERAREQFETVLRGDPANLVALKHLGDILFRDGQAAAAMAYYRRILEIDPHSGGLSSPVTPSETTITRPLTLVRPGENAPVKEAGVFQEPVMVTETIGDIYRDQGYFHLAGEVYRRLLARSDNSRIVEKLRAVEGKLNKKDGIHESSNREA